MKFIHLSDLHLGKRVNEFSMIEDQEYILRKILAIVDEEKPQAVLIAGDIYDKAVPSAEAVKLLDEFLVMLSERDLTVCIISGNHDSAERIAFGARLLNESGIYLSPVYEDGSVCKVDLTDEYGEVHIYLLPFVKPQQVKHAFPEEAEEIGSYTDALRIAITHMEVDTGERNILAAHQFVTGALRSDSESNVGGLDNVDASVFAPFDYTALGHIHGPQNVGENIRYCGTPLKYSFSEKDHKKSVTVVEMKKKGEIKVREVPLVPRLDMRVIRGTYDELTLKKNYEGTCTDDYLKVILTNEEDVPDALRKLQVIYPNIMQLEYDNTRTRHQQVEMAAADVRKTPLELLGELFMNINGKELSEQQKAYADALFEKITEER